jgi:hypothetical protein
MWTPRQYGLLDVVGAAASNRVQVATNRGAISTGADIVSNQKGLRFKIVRVDLAGCGAMRP